MNIIKQKRIELGLTQSELASRSGISRRTMIRWENGQTKPSSKKLTTLAEIFGCSEEELKKD